MLHTQENTVYFHPYTRLTLQSRALLGNAWCYEVLKNLFVLLQNFQAEIQQGWPNYSKRKQNSVTLVYVKIDGRHYYECSQCLKKRESLQKALSLWSYKVLPQVESSFLKLKYNWYTVSY